MDTTPSLNELSVIIGRTKGFLLTEQTAQQAVDGLAVAARDTIAHAEGAGVSLMNNGRRTSVGATDAHVLAADTLQYELGEGPCLTAWATGTPILIMDTATDHRWEQWNSAATDAGVRACLSVPLISRNEPIGAMKVYASGPNAFDTHDQALMVNFSRAAAALLGHIQASDTPQRISEEMKIALSSRDTIAYAVGILMERHTIGRPEALKKLHTLARTNRTTMKSQAATILNNVGTKPANVVRNGSPNGISNEPERDYDMHGKQ